MNCLDCHQPAGGQARNDHHGFVVSTKLTAGNCRSSCHEPIYQEFLRSRHAAPSWAAVYGAAGLTREQVNFSEAALTGAPPIAPLPFPNLIVLALIGLRVLGRRVSADPGRGAAPRSLISR